VASSGLTLLNFNTLRRDLPGQPAFLKNPRADHWDAYTYLEAIDVNYLVVCPTMIIEGNSDGNYLFEEKYFPQSEIKEIFAVMWDIILRKSLMSKVLNKQKLVL
jgi:hypothetical protein